MHAKQANATKLKREAHRLTLNLYFHKLIHLLPQDPNLNISSSTESRGILKRVGKIFSIYRERIV